MKRKKISPAMASLVIAGAGLGSAEVGASGFALVEQSVKQVGSAISGGSAVAEDASTIFFNPAGMTRLHGRQVVAGAHYIVPSAQFSGDATTNALLGGAAIGGGDGGEGANAAIAPTLYYSHELRDGLVLGVGVSAPFGMNTEYDSGWEGRYHAIKSDVKTLNINPSVAYKVNDQLSLGAGVDIMRAEATLTNAVDYSAACLGAVGAGSIPLAVCAGSGLVTPGTSATDGTVEVKGDDWSFGYNLGLLYEVNPKTRLGFAYRSEVEQKLTGTATFDAPNATARALLADTGASAKVTLPASLSLSLTTQVAPKWDVMADVTWTGWSSFDELRIKFDDGRADSVQKENWKDTYKVSVGFNYHYDQQWTWRGGVAYDQSPIRSATERTPRIPGNDRFWVAAGASYQMSPDLTLDFALAHLFVADTDINATDASFGHVLSGSYDSDVNIASAGLVWKF